MSSRKDLQDYWARIQAMGDPVERNRHEDDLIARIDDDTVVKKNK